MQFNIQRQKKIPKVLVILVFLGLLLTFFGVIKFFSVNKIFIKFINTPCEKIEVIKKNINVENENIFFLNSEKLETEIEEKFICIGEARTEKILPSQVSISLKSREPVLKINYLKLSTPSGFLSLKDINISSQSSQLNVPNSSLNFEKSYFVDNEGFVIATDSVRTSLTGVDFIGDEPKILTKLGSFISDSLKLIKGARKFASTPVKILIVQDKFLIFYSKPDVIFNIKKNPEEQITSLQLILQQAKMNSNRNTDGKNSKDIIKIDLRYDKPVITFSK